MVKCKLSPRLILCCIFSVVAGESVQKIVDTRNIRNVSHPVSKNSAEPANRILHPHDRRDDLAAAAGSFGSSAYLPPDSIECNPCNKEPWIPMMPNYVHHGSSNFVPPKNDDITLISNFNSIENVDDSFFSKELMLPDQHGFQHGLSEFMLPPPMESNFHANSPSNGYNSNLPGTYGPPGPVYGVPQKPIYGPPQRQTYGPPPRHSYGPPPRQTYGPPVKPTYGPPLKPNYGPPPKHGYGPPPKPDYGPPPKPDYGPPPKPDYGPPPKPDYGPPPKPDYGPPPKPNYGPPPKPDYGPPPKPDYGPPPKPDYGPPPKPDYGPPPKPNYGPPPKPDYGPPPKPDYGPPSKPNYGPPPKPDYGPPSAHNAFPASKSHFHSPLGITPPNPDYGLPPNNQYGPPPSPQYGSPKPNLNPPHYPPLSLGNQYNNPPTLPDIFALPHSKDIDFPTYTNGLTDVAPSDSYGNPVTPEAILHDTIPDSSGDNDYIALPNINTLSVLPVHPFQDFNQGFQSKVLRFSNQHVSGKSEVEIQPSVNVADYVASIEHPINVVQSPLVEVSVTEESDLDQRRGRTGNQIDETSEKSINQELEAPKVSLQENPIVVEDTHAAASDVSKTNTKSIGINQYKRNNNHLAISSVEKNNVSYENDDEITAQLIKEYLSTPTINNQTNFSPPTINYDGWQPSYTTTIPVTPPTTSVKPRWIQSTSQPNLTPPHSTFPQRWITQTSRPKQIQIIVPYTNHRKENSKKEVYTTLVPMYTPPMSTEESIWSKFMGDLKIAESKQVEAIGFTQPTTAVYNINDLIEATQATSTKEPPYDVVRLQKNINNWTHLSFATTDNNPDASKTIPEEYLSTIPYTKSTTTPKPRQSSENIDLETNLISRETTTPPSIPTDINEINKSSIWAKSYVTKSRTKEKVYVVTPQTYNFYTSTPATAWSMAPKVENGKLNDATFNSLKFTVKIEPDRHNLSESGQNAVKVVYSEWPHLINNLQTTTTTIRPTVRHPLLGLMDVTAYTPPPNGTVETFLGHSRVATVVTPAPPIKPTAKVFKNPR